MIDHGADLSIPDFQKQTVMDILAAPLPQLLAVKEPGTPSPLDIILAALQRKGIAVPKARQ